jgi:hypothetical protein
MMEVGLYCLAVADRLSFTNNSALLYRYQRENTVYEVFFINVVPVACV